jgi:hypothetical protein
MKNNKIPHCQDSSNRKITKYHTLRTVPTSMKNNKIPQSGQFLNIMKNKTYHTFITVPKYHYI